MDWPVTPDATPRTNIKEQFMQRVWFGSVSGMVATFIVHPMDLIRNNLAAENDQARARITSKVR